MGVNELRLRRFRESDAEPLADLANDPEVARYLRDRFPQPYRLQDAHDWIALTGRETRPCNFAVEWRGEVAGGIGIVPGEDIHSGTAELGYWLGRRFWGKGLATASVRLLLPYVWDELLFVRVYAMIFSGHSPSMRVLEKNGFVCEGVLRKHIRKHGVLYDAVVYGACKSDWKETSTRPGQ